MSKTGAKLNERRRAILTMLTQEGSVRVTQLSHQLGASAVTIRTDLEFLEQEGYLERVHGGAVSVRNNLLSFSPAKAPDAEAKAQLAKKVVSMIRGDCTLLMNDSPTNYFIAMELAKSADHNDLRVITNSFTIAAELSKSVGIQSILLGGILSAKQTFTYGSDALNQLESYRADKLILSVDGVDTKGGLTVRHSEDATLLQMMIQRSHQVLVVADYATIGYESFFRIAPLSVVQTLITNRKANPDVLEELGAQSIQVIKA